MQDVSLRRLVWIFLFGFVQSGQITSRYQRPASSRELKREEVDASCFFTFETYQSPGDDYFRGSGCASQVHMTQNTERSVTISFASPTTITPSRIRYSTNRNELRQIAWGKARSYTSLMSVNSYLYAPPMGSAFATRSEVRDVTNTTAWAVVGSASRSEPTEAMPDGLLSYQNPGAIYSSPLLHRIEVNDLEPGARYYYTLPDSKNIYSFRLAKIKQYPFRLGLTADVGQTVVSNASLWNLGQMDPDAIVIAGDLSYADGWPFRWDTFARLIEPIAARYPILHVGGNHEIGSSENWLHYLERWPTPGSASSPSPLFWSLNIGPVHVIGLNSYDNYVQNGDRIQREWLLSDLAHYTQYQRNSKQPWLAVIFHAPFYSSNDAHPLEAEIMRLAYEPILYAAGVDFIITGHVHAYERTTPVYNNHIDICGPTYFGLGDGGNRENTYINWTEPQPEWSVFRESSFGVGTIIIRDDTTLYYEWRREACANLHYQDIELPMNGISNLSALNCHTAGDDGGSAYLAVDALNLTKPSFSSCAEKRADAALSIGLDPRAFALPPRSSPNDLVFPQPRQQQQQQQHQVQTPSHSFYHTKLFLVLSISAVICLFILVFLLGSIFAGRVVLLNRSPSRIFYSIDATSAVTKSILAGNISYYKETPLTRSVPADLGSYRAVSSSSSVPPPHDDLQNGASSFFPSSVRAIQLT